MLLLDINSKSLDHEDRKTHHRIYINIYITILYTRRQKIREWNRKETERKKKG